MLYVPSWNQMMQSTAYNLREKTSMGVLHMCLCQAAKLCFGFDQCQGLQGQQLELGQSNLNAT